MSKPIPLAPELAEKLAALTLISFDVDGVLTDGRLFYGPEGEMMKAFHVRDGAALKLLAAQGIVVALITGRSSAMVARRAEELGIQHVYQGVAHKPDALAKLVATTGLSPTTMAHVGDDLPDLPLFTRVSVGSVPQTAIRWCERPPSLQPRLPAAAVWPPNSPSTC